MEDTVAEKKPRTTGDGCNGEPSGTAESGGGGGGGLVERLPEALLVEVLGRLDLDDACSAAAYCRSLHAAANAALSAITAIDLSTLWVKFPLLDPHSEYETGTGLPLIPSNIKDLLLQPVSHSRATTVFLNTTSLSKHITDSLESLSLVLDTITDELVMLITSNVHKLVELCLEDEPVTQPNLPEDLTNVKALGLCHNLRHLSLTRRCCDFRRVNDFGILMLADGCKQLRTIRFGGFSKVSDAGYAALLHSGKDLKKFEVSNGSCLSDLACLDLDKAAPNISEVRLLNCALLTSDTAISLAPCTNLKVLDLSGCKSIADSGLVSISRLPNLTLLDLAGADITDAGLSALGNGRCLISSLCLRGCRRIGSNGIASLLCGTGTINKTLVSLF
ncbi:unnamed protein product [Miscanthus lutarioriparius]|uniref:F-box/LRR-repeat protein 15-like leucin rich repeat domain-containing protein n=1 Tax=Miscanthus lutarioriparius TaxID=422564 RepID=A0A811PNL7_9POAL|nr:unnamed protein product [Miscanthus lutarioriparius]